MDDNISVLMMPNNLVIISQIERITPTVIGDPDVRLIEPFILTYTNNRMLTEDNNSGSNYVFTPWLMEYTDDNDFFLHSEKFLVSMNPTNLLKHLYNKQLKKSTLSND